MGDLVSEQLVNTIKWIVPGLLLFVGCRTRHQIKVALIGILLMYALWTFQIVRAVPARAILEPGSATKFRGYLPELVGLSPNHAAKLMSGVPWAMLAIMPVLKKSRYRFFMLGACAICLYALALTGGRAGYIACGATIVFLCIIRWRRYLLLLPVVAVLVLPVALPGATSRILSGFGATNVAGEEVIDKNTALAG